MCHSRTGCLIFGWAMVIYALIQIAAFMYMFTVDMEPDWISLFKLMCDFLLLASAILLIIAVMKDNMTIILIAEVMFLVTAFAFLLYFIILLLLFIRNEDFGANFWAFLVQRLLFLGGILIGLVCIEMLRKEMWPCNDFRCRGICPSPVSSCYTTITDRDRLKHLDPEEERRRELNMGAYEFRNTPSAVKNIKPISVPTEGPEGSPDYRGEEYSKSQGEEFSKSRGEEYSKSRGEECSKPYQAGGNFGRSMSDTGPVTEAEYEPVDPVAKACADMESTRWQQHPALSYSSDRPLGLVDLEGIRNIRGLGIGFPGSLGLCKDLPPPGSSGGTYTPRAVPDKSTVHVV